MMMAQWLFFWKQLYGNDGYSSYTFGNSTYGNDGYSSYSLGIVLMVMMVTVLILLAIQFTEVMAEAAIHLVTQYTVIEKNSIYNLKKLKQAGLQRKPS